MLFMLFYIPHPMIFISPMSFMFLKLKRILFLFIVCDACQRAKSHQLPYNKSTSVSFAPLDLVCSDVWGPAPQSVGRHKYYVSFIDDYSRFTWIYLLKNKSDVFQVFLNFQKLVEGLFNKKIITLRTDGGGEYQKLSSFFEKVGISHHFSCPHASTKQNCKTQTLSHC